MTTKHNLSLLAGLALLCAPTLAQTSVDLSSRQSPLQSQGGRTTCITFAAVAALEAAYKRVGYRVDLSEEFLSYTGKMMWLHPNWNTAGGPSPRLASMGPNWTENQVGAFGGGSGPGTIDALANGFRTCEERYMPYKTSGYTLPYSDWKHLYWKLQSNVNKFNLDPNNLPRKALAAGRFYRVKSYVKLSYSQSRNPVSIESALKSGYEVVWDFRVGGTRTTNTIWKAGTEDAEAMGKLGGHSMLIVGYNRSNRDPAKHYFIVKNSWGRTTLPRYSGTMNATGFTHISYDYLKKYGYNAAYITSVHTPAQWPEIAFIGRRNLCFDGWRGTLDVYHIPGIRQKVFNDNRLGITDRRIGTFTDTSGKVFRVNGEIKDNKMVFWLNSKRQNICWGDQRVEDGKEHRFVYYMVNPMTGELGGFHHSNKGTIASPAWGGYARVPSTITGTDGFVRPIASSYTNRPEHFLGRWKVHFDSVFGYMNVLNRNDLAIPTSMRTLWAGLECEFVENGSNRRTKFVAYVLKSRPAQMWFSFTHGTRSRVTFTSYMLSWQRGVFAGTGSSRSKANGIYGYRIGTASTPSVFGRIGSGCKGSNGKILTQSVSGSAYLGKTALYKCSNALPNTSGFLVTGLGATSLGIDLGFMGAPGCKLYPNLDLMASVKFNKAGSSYRYFQVPDDRMFYGVSFYTQFAAADARANGGGLVTSNAYWTKIGGPR